MIHVNSTPFSLAKATYSAMCNANGEKESSPPMCPGEFEFLPSALMTPTRWGGGHLSRATFLSRVGIRGEDDPTSLRWACQVLWVSFHRVPVEVRPSIPASVILTQAWSSLVWAFATVALFHSCLLPSIPHAETQ